jgi:hypothetical protein
MGEIYSRPSEQANLLQPKKETLQFILDYSKSLKILGNKNIKIDIHQN